MPKPKAARPRMPKSKVTDPLIQMLEEEVLKICQAQPQGLADKQIAEQLKIDVKPNNRIAAYNNLLNRGRLALGQKQTSGKSANEVVYKWVSTQEAAKFRGLDNSDRLVYDLIEKSSQTGMTKLDLKYRSNIRSGHELKTIVDRLVSRGLIKEIKSVQGANRRVYIISELEPSPLHTGGPWYNDDQEFDTEFIEAIYNQVLAYMKRHPFLSVEQVTSYVADTKLSNEALSQRDIRALMSTMLYDGAIEECEGFDESGEYYRPCTPTPAVNHLSSIPCGSCPVMSHCTPEGVISPKTCVYMTEWLKAAADW